MPLVPDLATAPGVDQLTRGFVAGIEYFTIGRGEPVTLFAHGLAGSIAETRPLAADVVGTRVFVHFRGHGGSAPIVDGWDYDMLSADLLTVADHLGVTQGAGVSMGAGALMRLAVDHPTRLGRIAFIMPAALTQTRTDGAVVKLVRIAEAMSDGDHDVLTAYMLDEVPAALHDRRAVRLLAARRARDLIGTEPPVAKPGVRPLHDLAELGRVGVPCLVLAQAADDLHSLDIAQTLAEALPNSELVVLPPGGVYWTEHKTARAVLAAHFADSKED